MWSRGLSSAVGGHFGRPSFLTWIDLGIETVRCTTAIYTSGHLVLVLIHDLFY